MNDPICNTHVLRAGCDLPQARSALVLLHGRGATSESILPLGLEIADAATAILAPQAINGSWYPYSFLAPMEQNEPQLSASLSMLAELVAQCAAAGVARRQIAIAGFSQGACLATEFTARNPDSAGALLAFTGGLIGPPKIDLHHAGSLAGCSALLSSGDPDPHVPWSRVQASAEELERMGAQVELLRIPGRPHTVLAVEIEAARKLLERHFTR